MSFIAESALMPDPSTCVCGISGEGRRQISFPSLRANCMGFDEFTRESVFNRKKEEAIGRTEYLDVEPWLQKRD